MQRKIFFITLAETDATGVIYYPSLFRLHLAFFEELLRSGGFSVFSPNHPDGLLMPVRKASAECFEPIFLGDQLEQQVFVSHIGKSSVTLESFFFKEGRLAAKALALHVYVRLKDRKAAPIPKELYHHLQQEWLVLSGK